MILTFERPKRHSCRNEKKNYGAHQKNLNEDRFILSAAKCRPMILVCRNVKYMRIFAGVPRKGHQLSNDSNGHALRPLILHVHLLGYFRRQYVSPGHAYWPLSSTGTLLREFEWKKRNVSYFSANWAQKCPIFNSTIRHTMKSIIYHAKHIGLHSVVLCTISAFWTVAAVFSADNVSQIMNVKAINRYI